ncbi:MAG: hypothetical protein KKA42_09560 [candidate division Zixibacteria bacterium]|nr:hypothetical protein [candidate division Zixibacteria bacterium]
MRGGSFDSDYDLAGLIARPLYFGMLVNIGLPAVLLFVCYYINQNSFVANSIPSWANQLFYVLVFVALCQSGAAIYWRWKVLQQPMVRREETFEEDIARELLVRSRPIFILIASISIWGFVYFYATGRFQETALFVIFSFVVFQVVRPRYGFVRKVIEHQKALVEAGTFYRGKDSLLS